MDPSQTTSLTISNGGTSVQSSKLNIFLWNFFMTLTLSSMLLMVLSIYYSFFASMDGNRGVLSTIIITFAMMSYMFIIPNLAQIAAVAIPYVEANRHLSIRLLIVGVWMIGGVEYPFLVYFSCSSLMAGLGLLKLYGDGGPVFKRVIDVILMDAIEPCVHMFSSHKKMHGTGSAEFCGTGWAFVALFIMGFLAMFFPPLVEPEKKMMNATATLMEMNMAEAEIPAGDSGTNEDI